MYICTDMHVYIYICIYVHICITYKQHIDIHIYIYIQGAHASPPTPCTFYRCAHGDNMVTRKLVFEGSL